MAEQNSTLAADAPQELDLFGAPLTQVRDRWGRPSFKTTKENKEFVAARVAMGWTQKRIAAAIGCDEKTLRKNFSRELEHGRDIIEGMAIDVLMHKMRQGNGPAITKVLERIDMADLKTKPEPQKKPAPLGKKDQLRAAAHEPVGSWAETLNTEKLN